VYIILNYSDKSVKGNEGGFWYNVTMKNHKREEDNQTPVIPAVLLLVVLNCVVWSAVLRSFPLLLIGAVLTVVYLLR
jgi:hypothetical protein